MARPNTPWLVGLLVLAACSEDAPPVPPRPAFPPTCLGLCQKTAHCQQQVGAPVGADEQSCETSCAPGGRYASLPPAAWMCVAQPCGAGFVACPAQAVAAAAGVTQTGVLQQLQQAGTQAPEGYPEGFPFIAGGQVQPSPPGPPGLRALTVTYPQSPPDLQTALTGLLQQTGWTVQTSPPSPRGTIRMTATRGTRSVRVSILPGPGGQGSGLLLMP